MAAVIITVAAVNAANRNRANFELNPNHRVPLPPPSCSSIFAYRKALKLLRIQVTALLVLVAFFTHLSIFFQSFGKFPPFRKCAEFPVEVGGLHGNDPLRCSSLLMSTEMRAKIAQLYVVVLGAFGTSLWAVLLFTLWLVLLWKFAKQPLNPTEETPDFKQETRVFYLFSVASSLFILISWTLLLVNTYESFQRFSALLLSSTGCVFFTQLVFLYFVYAVQKKVEVKLCPACRQQIEI
ncbi:hypothetical protein M3Y99_01543400 [Aphelenchoides fujianensis]|nr:hypothetical protein M3Y99_01543400 [Aphelenchoides fujianensis]